MTDEPKPPKTLGTFASLLREERKRLGWTQVRTAQFLEVHHKTLEAWENDRYEALAVTQEGALARLYGVATPPEPLPKIGKPIGKKAVDNL